MKYTLDGVCDEHEKWANKNPGGPSFSHHAFNHTTGVKGEYCFWCNIHHSGNHYYDGNVNEFTQEDWDRDVEAQLGEPVDDVMTKVHAFYDSLSPEDRKRVCSFSPMGHPYPSLLT